MSQTGFPVIKTDHAYRVIRIRNGKMKPIREAQPFCDLATPDQEAAGLYGLLEYRNGDLDRCRAAALHASHFGDAFTVEAIATKTVVAEYENGTEVAIGATRFAH
jgi:hypothetical protein